MSLAWRGWVLITALWGSTALPVMAKPYVCMQTTVGEFCMELLPEAAPTTVANFLQYVNDGDYANTMIHRSEPGKLLQSGGYKVFSNLIGFMSVRGAIADEFNQPNRRGTVAMARLGGRNSAMSQWYINLADNPAFDTQDGGATVFARIVQGMDVVDSIAALRRLNLVSVLGDAFDSVPTTAAAGVSVPEATDYVRVTRAYETATLPGATPLLPYQCSAASAGDTLTEFCGSSLSLPVSVGSTLYEATLALVAGRSGLVFTVDSSKLKALADSGQPRASFSDGVLTIPSVRVGSQAYVNVKLNLTRSAPLEFTVVGFTLR